jgi:hypothetical protein
MAMRIHQPIPETAGRVVTPDGPVEVLPYQIVVMVSIAASRVIALPADAPRSSTPGTTTLRDSA